LKEMQRVLDKSHRSRKIATLQEEFPTFSCAVEGACDVFLKM